AYDAATGTPLWEKAFDGHSHGGSDAAWAIGTSPDGSSVYVSGSAYIDGTGNDYATVAYAAASGALLWVATAGAAQEDIANAPAARPRGFAPSARPCVSTFAALSPRSLSYPANSAGAFAGLCPYTASLSACISLTRICGSASRSIRTSARSRVSAWSCIWRIR